MNIQEIKSYSYHFFKLLTKGYSDKLLGISVDITNKCNLKCKHCYWWENRESKELSDNEWIKLVKKIKKENPYIIQGFWLGGEPLLRAKLLEKLFKYFKLNSVITNAVLPLPRWSNVNFTVSMDGIEKDYEKIRGKGVYKKVKKNILKNKDLDLHLSCTLNKINFCNIDEFVKEWYDNQVQGLNFTIHTEIKGGNKSIGFSLKERDKVIDKIIMLKSKYNNFIYGSKSHYHSMKSKTCKKAAYWCRQHYAKMGMCLDSMGKVKKPCIFGPIANCDYCGCPLPYIMYAAKNKDLSAMLDTLKHNVFK
ncbi:radical SAM protein [Patescibacteria group bacterium]